MWRHLSAKFIRGRPERRPAARRAAPRLECLEDRLAPATFTVNTTLASQLAGDGKLSLREAIHKANGRPGADLIVVPAGVYTIGLGGQGDDNNFVGDFDVKRPVTIRGAGAGKTVFDGQQLDRVFDLSGHVPSSFTVVLQGLTVRNGSVVGSGEGIQVDNADLVVRDCAFSGNRATNNGGGISSGDFSLTGNVTIVRTTVVRNAAGNSGGGLRVLNLKNNVVVKDSSIRRNTAANGGGGIDSNNVRVTNCFINGNSTSGSGGGISAGGGAILANCIVSGNTAGGWGGGVIAEGVTLTLCTVSGNSAWSQGGGIATAVANFTNVTVSGNRAGTEGGGVSANHAILTGVTGAGSGAASGAAR